jgi:hypothetical protein
MNFLSRNHSSYDQFNHVTHAQLRTEPVGPQAKTAVLQPLPHSDPPPPLPQAYPHLILTDHAHTVLIMIKHVSSNVHFSCAGGK